MGRSRLTRYTHPAAAGLLGLSLSFTGLAFGEAGKSAQSERSASPPEAKPGAAPLPQVSEQADRLLHDMSDYLKAANEFTFRAHILYDDILPSGQKILFSGLNDVAVHRPGRLYSHGSSDAGDKRLWYDGKQVTLFDERHAVYATEKAPRTIDATLDFLIGELRFTPPLSDLLYSDPYSVLRRNTLFGFHVGVNDIDGHRCHHLAFVERNIDWQVWIDDGLMRVPRRLAITYKTLPGAPQFIATLTDWNFNARFADSIFAPSLPPAATKIEFLKVAKPAANAPAPKGAK